MIPLNLGGLLESGQDPKNRYQLDSSHKFYANVLFGGFVYVILFSILLDNFLIEFDCSLDKSKF